MTAGDKAAALLALAGWLGAVRLLVWASER